ncbi:hypothetical protein, partial [Nonomuraea sp. NPDC003201]
REGRPDAAAEHVARAGARLDGVRGAGARITPLLVSLRLAVRCRDRGLVDRVAGLARTDAEVKRDVRALRTIGALV